MTMRTPLQLTPELLLSAYAIGLFPMAEERTGRIDWYSPDPRAILPLEAYRPPRSLRQVVKRNLFEIRINAAFEAVMRACAGPRRDEEGTWISEEMIGAYTQLHRRGFAHSVEAYVNDRLVGGLYGVAIGGAFFGESMFYRVPNASKVALHALVGRLQRQGYDILDTQILTEHTQRFGAIEIPREEYLRRLAQAIASPVRFE